MRRIMKWRGWEDAWELWRCACEKRQTVSTWQPKCQTSGRHWKNKFTCCHQSQWGPHRNHQESLCSIWILKTCRWTSGFQLGESQLCGKYVICRQKDLCWVEEYWKHYQSPVLWQTFSLPPLSSSFKVKSYFHIFEKQMKHLKCLLYILYCTKQ